MIDPTRLKRRKVFVDPRQKPIDPDTYGQNLALWRSRGLRLREDFSDDELKAFQRRLEDRMQHRQCWTPWPDEEP